MFPIKLTQNVKKFTWYFINNSIFILCPIRGPILQQLQLLNSSCDSSDLHAHDIKFSLERARGLPGISKPQISSYGTDSKAPLQEGSVFWTSPHTFCIDGVLQPHCIYGRGWSSTPCFNREWSCRQLGQKAHSCKHFHSIGISRRAHQEQCHPQLLQLQGHYLSKRAFWLQQVATNTGGPSSARHYLLVTCLAGHVDGTDKLQIKGPASWWTPAGSSSSPSPREDTSTSKCSIQVHLYLIQNTQMQVFKLGNL